MRAHSEMMWVCGMSEYWWSWTDGVNWWYGNYYIPTYCDSGDVGGCVVGGLEPSSSAVQRVIGLSYCGGDGGDGSGGTGNNQISDPTLHAAVDNAKGNAITKLGNTQCQAMIRNNKNAAGISLWDVMTSYAADPATYIDTQVSFVKGDGTIDIGSGLVPCNYGRLAWVSVPGVHTVDVCGSFSGLSTGLGGVTLIHEMLHTLGLPEGPPDYTSEQIQQMVVDWCGSQ